MKLIYFANRSDAQQNIERYDIVDIGVNSIANNSLLHFAPHIMRSRICLAVPVARKLSLDKYFKHSMKESLLLFWLFTVAMNVLVKRLSNPRTPWLEICYAGLKLLIGLCAMSRDFRSLRPAGKIIELFTQFFIVLISGLIVSALTTSIIFGYYEPDINSVQDLLDSGLRIMIDDPEQLQAFERNELPRELLPRTLLVNRSVRQQHFLHLDTSYAYAVESYKWPTFAMIQQRMRNPKLRLASKKLCTAYRTFVFNVRPDMPFSDMFQKFVDTSHEMGLVRKWRFMGLQQALQLGMINRKPYEPIRYYKLPLEFFEDAFMAYGIGMAASLVAFALKWMHAIRLRAHELG